MYLKNSAIGRKTKCFTKPSPDATQASTLRINREVLVPRTDAGVLAYISQMDIIDQGPLKSPFFYFATIIRKIWNTYVAPWSSRMPAPTTITTAIQSISPHQMFTRCSFIRHGAMGKWVLSRKRSPPILCLCSIVKSRPPSIVSASPTTHNYTHMHLHL